MDIQEPNFQQLMQDMTCRHYQMSAKPLYLMLGLTNVCNLNCAFCPYCGFCTKKIQGREELALGTLEKLSAYFPTARFLNPSLRGEPFLYTHFEQFLDLCKARGEGTLGKMQLINNGTQLHKHDLKKLEGINVVSISFDAADKKTFEALRCGANFEQVLQNMEKLRADLPGTVLQLTVVVCRLNLRQLADIYLIAREKGFGMITFNAIYGPREDRVVQLLRLRESDRAELERQMEKIRQLNSDQQLSVFDVTTFDGFEDGEPWDYERIYEQLHQLKGIEPYLDFDEDACMDQEDRRVHLECRSCGQADGHRLPYCTNPWLTMSVLPDGKIQPCCAAYAIVDDMTDKAADEVWNGENFRNLREAMFDWEMLPDFCKRCKVFMRYDYINEYVDYLKDNGVQVEDIQIPPHYYPKRELIRDDVLWDRICRTHLTGEDEAAEQDANQGSEEKKDKGERMMGAEINTKEYWDGRFSSGDWDLYEGELQSSFFSEIAVNALPDWMKRELSRNDWTVVDCGCAEGMGTAFFARRFPKCRFVGVDFSAAAIEKATKDYPYCEFKVADITKEVEPADVIFCSNVLEHMKHPYAIFQEIIEKSRQHTIILIPLKDSLNLAEHFYVFDESFFPVEVKGRVLSYFRVIDCERMNSPYWPGQQLLLIYSNKDVYDPSAYQLSDMFSNTEYEALKREFGKVRAERDQGLARATALEGEKQTLTAQVAQAEQEKQTLLAQVAQAEQEKQTLTVQVAQAEQEKQTLSAQIEQELAEKQGLTLQNALADKTQCQEELSKYQESAEQMETALQEQAQQIMALKTENQALCSQNRVIMDQHNAAICQINAMIGSRLFKLIHLINRFRKQGLHQNREERRKFRKWLFSRLRHMPDRDHRYNPMFALLEILGKEVPSVSTAATMMPAISILDTIKPEMGKLRKHLEEQRRYLDEAAAGPLSAEAQKLREAIHGREYKGILIYPHVVFWEPLQTPQQILRAFAKEGWLCFFCEAPWQENACREVEPNLFITYEKDLLQSLGDTPVTVLLTWIGSISFVERIQNKTIWYHILDHLEIFAYYDHYYQKIHNAMLETAQVVSYVAAPLKAECGNRQDAIYLPNAVNPEEMKKITPDFVPADMAPILAKNHKIVGYYGYLAEWMDYELVRQMALERPEYEFVFIGQAIHDTSLIEPLENVHLLGLKPYHELFDYAKFFDVATIPFLIDEKMDCVSPIKFYEYLALGLPVVSSSMKELEPYAQQYDFICTAKNKDEFLFYVDAVMKPEARKNAKEYGEIIAWKNSWTARVRQMELHLQNKDYAMLDQAYTKTDIIVLSIIDYDFRHQRPQHFAQRFAQNGHRVFYVNANFTNAYSAKELEDNLWQITLPNEACFSIHLTDWADQQAEMRSVLDGVIREWFIRDALVVVDYPNWVLAAEYLRKQYGFKMVTDYMDDFTGFLNPAEDLVRKNCTHLLEESDAVVASSQFLYEIAVKYNSNVSISRNGTDYAYFHKAYQNQPALGGKKRIGYYGAIAEWFHADIVCQCAREFPDCEIVLVGNISAHRAELEKYENIRLVGEVPYQQLLPWLESFDVCLIPFDTSTDLIKATNPVKFYEYLSAGKKIVATRIPELEPYEDRFVYLENDPEKFCDRVRECLNGTDSLACAEECFAFARENDWDCRAAAFGAAAFRTYPKISIIVLCYNQLDYTKECVESILTKTAYPNYELILVDNHSSDDTAAYLKTLAAQYEQIKIVLNQTNRGFAGGNNDGLKVADGDYLVLLNNDTVVTRGWLTGLLKHYQGTEPVGLVGPVTNSIANEAQINTYYASMAEMDPFAYEYTQAHMGEEYPHKGILAMFCLMISRELYEKAGPLDENYGRGMFEDDDYTKAAQQQGYRVVMAEDVFIHHYGNVSFKKLEDAEYMKLWEKNKRYFEKKWRVKWKKQTMRTKE